MSVQRLGRNASRKAWTWLHGMKDIFSNLKQTHKTTRHAFLGKRKREGREGGREVRREGGRCF